VAETWRRVWGGQKFCSQSKISERRFFLKKMSVFTDKISYDLFYFLVIDQVFRIFPFFSQIFRIFAVLNVVYDPFLTRKTTISENNSFMTPFFYSVRTFARIRQHYFSKYWEYGCMGRPTTSNFGGTVPPVPPRSHPMIDTITQYCHFLLILT